MQLFRLYTVDARIKTLDAGPQVRSRVTIIPTRPPRLSPRQKNVLHSFQAASPKMRWCTSEGATTTADAPPTVERCANYVLLRKVGMRGCSFRSVSQASSDNVLVRSSSSCGCNAPLCMQCAQSIPQGLYLTASSSNNCVYAATGVINLEIDTIIIVEGALGCLLYTSPSPRDKRQSRMPSSA